MTRLPNMPGSGGPTEPEEPQTLSLLGGVAGGGGMSEAELLEADSKRRGGGVLSQTGLVIAAMVVLGAGSLYAMRLTQGSLSAGTSTEVERKIEQTLAKLQVKGAVDPDSPLNADARAALFQDVDQILASFNADPTAHQVPVDRVKKDPFVIDTPAVAGTAAPDTSARDRTKKLEALQRELSGYTLQTIMISGSRTVAVVDGEFYQPGQKLGSFAVESMDTLSVQLVAEGERFVLTLNNPTQSNRK